MSKRNPSKKPVLTTKRGGVAKGQHIKSMNKNKKNLNKGRKG